MLSYSVNMVAKNLEAVRRRMEAACRKAGRTPQEVTLVCVTKTATPDLIEEALRAGAVIFGENRVQDAIPKCRRFGERCEWHLVGHLQTNKAADAVRIFSLIHSLDSIRLAEALDREAGKIGTVQGVLIQVNTSGEASKFGLRPDELASFIKDMAVYNNISIKGLMTIAPEVNDPELVRPYFMALRELRDRLYEIRDTRYEIRDLSMGMTDDFEVAIEEGATIVRIGRAIFA